MKLKALTACIVVIALAALAPAAAWAVEPPPGTPDLSQMVLQPSDFTTTSVTSDGYTDPDGAVASYERDFGLSVAPAGTFLDIMSSVELEPDAATSAANFSILELLLHSGTVKSMILKELGKQHIKKKNVRVGKVQQLAIGDGAAMLPLRIRVSGIWFNVDLVFLHRDRVDGMLLALGAGIKAPQMAALAGTMVTHIDAVLAPRREAEGRALD
jgi:hypothetical protein